jgi:hypothetical protein
MYEHKLHMWQFQRNERIETSLDVYLHLVGIFSSLCRPKYCVEAPWAIPTDFDMLALTCIPTNIYSPGHTKLRNSYCISSLAARAGLECQTGWE